MRRVRRDGRCVLSCVSWWMSWVSVTSTTVASHARRCAVARLIGVPSSRVACAAVGSWPASASAASVCACGSARSAVWSTCTTSSIGAPAVSWVAPAEVGRREARLRDGDQRVGAREGGWGLVRVRVLVVALGPARQVERLEDDRRLLRPQPTSGSPPSARATRTRSARATRTRSRAAPRSSPIRQSSQCAQQSAPCAAQPEPSSKRRIGVSSRCSAASMCEATSAISSARRSTSAGASGGAIFVVGALGVM